MKNAAGLVLFLVVVGAAWGVTIPLMKIAVSDGYRHFGLIFWQFIIGAVALTFILIWQRKPLPLGRNQLRLYMIIALIGTLIPNAVTFEAARHLPAGILAIVISLVPMFAFPIALLMRVEGFSWARLFGLLFGLVGVLLLTAPSATLPGQALGLFVLFAMIGPVLYGLEGNVIAKWGTYGCGPFQVLLGSQIIGAILTVPLVIATGQFINPLPPYGAPDFALITIAIIHAFAYSGYVWIVGKGGAVFAAQVAYLVTGFGILFSMLFLGETYAANIWLAMMVIFVGLFMVQPKLQADVLAADQ